MGGAIGLGLFGSVALLAGVVMLISLANVRRGGTNVALTGLALVGVGVAVLGAARVPITQLLRGETRRIVLDKSEIALFGGKGATRLGWANVKDVFATDSQCTIRSTDGTTIEFSSDYENFDEMVSTIRRNSNKPV